MKFRKKPVVIEAIQWTGNVSNELRDLIGDWKNWSYEPIEGALFIHTLEGHMKASLNDWIIKGIKGEFYPCKPDIFEASYEKAE